MREPGQLGCFVRTCVLLRERCALGIWGLGSGPPSCECSCRPGVERQKGDPTWRKKEETPGCTWNFPESRAKALDLMEAAFPVGSWV